MKNHICLEIKFGVGGNAPEYQLDGWSHPEVGMTWAVGKRSRLCLPRPSGKFGCVLEIEATAFTPGDTLVSQCITLFVDGEEVGRESFHGRRRMSFRLPTDEGRPSEMIVEIHHPDASRPTDFSDSPDIRELSIMIAFMRLITIDEAWGLPECRNSMIRMKSDAISPE